VAAYAALGLPAEREYRSRPRLRSRPTWRPGSSKHSFSSRPFGPRGHPLRGSGVAQIAEAAAADAGAGRALLTALRGYAHAQGLQQIGLALAPAHPVARAALHLGGAAHINATPDDAGRAALAGVVDLPAVLEALVPEFEPRLGRSRYAGWSGNLRVETETERVTLAFAAGRATLIDGSRPADVRLRRLTLPALAQLLLGYRAAADLRATGGLDCDDSTLGLIDALFPNVLACGGTADDTGTSFVTIR
jgi:predicted acetyltransferase